MVTARHARGVALGLVVDSVLGDPPNRAHPVAWFGTAMTAWERAAYKDSRAAGVVHAAVGLSVGAVAGRACRSTVAATAVAVAGRGLRDAAGSIASCLAHDDLRGARALLPSLVGRDPSDLDADEIARAVVESVAENTVDAVVAPALWAAVGGASGALTHRAVNTMDAMVGHRSARYDRYGWASARLDDAAAWVPARVTALLVAAVRPTVAARIARAVRDQAPAHPSPNAGVAEAAFAAALGIRLGGANRYGERVERRPDLGIGPAPGHADIGRACRLSDDVSVALGLALVAVGRKR